MIFPEQFMTLVERGIEARLHLLDERHETAVRLFNGFLEGCPQLVVDLFGETAVLYNYANPPEELEDVVTAAQQLLRQQYPWLQAILLKTRHGSDAEKRGVLLWGSTLTTKIREHGVRYALDLTMNQDTSFYLDTRLVRRWALDNLAGKDVLNSFAYTGSLGVAAAAEANRVLHTDLNKRFLNVAKTSYTLNGFPIDKKLFQTGDFWRKMSQLKRAGEQFDCVFLDPPFFSQTAAGTVDLNEGMARLVNKVRPLVKHGGHIIAINNALYVSGADYLAELETLCADGYVEIEQLLSVPEDCTGYPHTQNTPPITDSAPFNHSTKIALLKIYHQKT
ncbi:class I SAM-dependent methyltransferase [Candidatus Leptofilum sp.]|uniref:class I SAM-dependent methyltransferase n=1 Tax=Candidatus Leptofilum sp. TaxID=3241576 RepID=UPI003B5CD978